jgi:methionyl-tRNA formyltransferase
MRYYLVAGRQPWNEQHLAGETSNDDGTWEFCVSPEELIEKTNSDTAYRYIFFLHWSEKIPEIILNRFECVCFHMTDVPFGRGGSPLQNLIVRGYRETVLSALKMTSEFDAGPVYMKRQLSLEGGTAEEIYLRASQLSCKMALEIASTEPEPQPQVGDVLVFRRRQPADSCLPVDVNKMTDVFDHIRMLDAEGYPRAFLEIGNLRFEFSRAAHYNDGIRADVTITLKDGEQAR